MNSRLTTELEDIRTEIRSTDLAIVGLLAQRAQLARAVGAAKEAHGLPVCDPAREAAVLREAAAAARSQGIDAEIVRQIFWCVIGLCRGAQLDVAHE